MSVVQPALLITPGNKEAKDPKIDEMGDAMLTPDPRETHVKMIDDRPLPRSGGETCMSGTIEQAPQGNFPMLREEEDVRCQAPLMEEGIKPALDTITPERNGVLTMYYVAPEKLADDDPCHNRERSAQPSCPQLMIRVGRDPAMIPALLDSGAEMSCISHEYLKTLTEGGNVFPTVPVSGINIFTATGRRSKRVKDQVLLPISFQGYHLDVNALVVEQLIKPVIIGQDWMEMHQVTLSCMKIPRPVVGANERLVELRNGRPMYLVVPDGDRRRGPHTPRLNRPTRGTEVGLVATMSHRDVTWSKEDIRNTDDNGARFTRSRMKKASAARAKQQGKFHMEVFDPGDRVLLRVPGVSNLERKEMAKRRDTFQGPFVTARRLHNAYELTMPDGRPKGKFNVRSLKPYRTLQRELAPVNLAGVTDKIERADPTQASPDVRETRIRNPTEKGRYGEDAAS